MNQPFFILTAVLLLQSRTIFDRVVDKFDLMKLYDVDSRVDARKKLTENIGIDADAKSGIITVSVEDKDPKRAADMANTFVDELRILAKGIAISEASQRRLFYEEQLKATKLSLTRAEEEMKAFGENTGALQVEEQAKAVIEGIANLRAQIAAKEVEIKVMRTYSTHRATARAPCRTSCPRLSWSEALPDNLSRRRQPDPDGERARVAAAVGGAAGALGEPQVVPVHRGVAVAVFDLVRRREP